MLWLDKEYTNCIFSLSNWQILMAFNCSFAGSWRGVCGAKVWWSSSKGRSPRHSEGLQKVNCGSFFLSYNPKILETWAQSTHNLIIHRVRASPPKRNDCNLISDSLILKRFGRNSCRFQVNQIQVSIMMEKIGNENEVINMARLDYM